MTQISTGFTQTATMFSFVSCLLAIFVFSTLFCNIHRASMCWWYCIYTSTLISFVVLDTW